MPVDEPRARWAGRSLAERRAERRRLLLSAAFALLGAGDISDVTIRSVARDAGVHRRYFYESFSSRDALLEAMFDEAAHGVLDDVAETLVRDAPRPVRERLRLILLACFEHARTSAAEARLLAWQDTESVLQRKRQELLARARALILVHDAPGGDARQDEVLGSMLEGAICELCRRYANRETDMDIETAADIATEGFLALLQLGSVTIRGDDSDESVTALLEAVNGPAAS